MTKTSRGIRKKLREKLFQNKQVPQYGRLGNYEHVVEVPGRPNYVYIRFAGQVVSEVFNDRVAPLEDLEVVVGYDPEEPDIYQVLDVRSNLKRYSEEGDVTNYLPEHAHTHEWMNYPAGGNDVVFVDLRQFMPLRFTPIATGASIYYHKGMIYGDDKWEQVTGGYVSFAPYIPSTGARYALLSHDIDGLPDITFGDVKDTLLLTLDDVPDPNPGTYPIAAIRLYQGQTRIAEAYSNTDIIDLRFPGTRPFTSLYDTPVSFTGSATMGVFVNATEDGLEFSDIVLGGDLTGTHDNAIVQGLLGYGLYAATGHPADGDRIEFNGGTSRWELVTGSVTGAAASITKWYSPLDYGGVGDGVTDDTSAVNSAIADIPADGGVLYFPAGYKFYTYGGFQLNKPITVKGMGNAENFDAHFGTSTVLCGSGSSTLFEVNSYGCSFEDIFLMGITGSTPTAGAGITVVDGGDLMHFKNVTSHSFFIGIDIQDGFAWHMDHCFMVNTAKYGVKIQHVGFVDGGDQFIDNCIFWADGRTSDAAVRLESGGGLKINNTKIVGSGQSDKQYHYGLDVYLQDTVATSVIFVNDTSIENVDTNGIRIVTSPNAASILNAVVLDDIEIAMNDKGAGSAAIYMSNQGTGTLQWVLIDNILAFDWNDSITDQAIYLDGLDHVRIGTLLRDGFGDDLAIPNCTDVVYFGTGTSGSGASNFLGLNDTPPSYTGSAGRYIKVDALETGLEFSTSTGSVGATVFTDLGDVPSSYSGEASKVLAVNSGETGIEFINPSFLSGTFSGAKAYHNVDFAVTGSVVILVPFNSEYYDSDSYHVTGSIALGNTKLTFPTNGYYEIGVQIKWADSTTGVRELYLKKDGTTYVGINTRNAPTAGTVAQVFSIQDYFTGSSYVQLEAFHNVGSPQNIVYADRYSPQIWVKKL